MHYHLCDHIYVAQFRDELILLDLRADKYSICFNEFSDLLRMILEGKDIPTHVSSQVRDLLKNKVIEIKTMPFPYFVDRKAHSLGVSNIDWRLPLNNKESTITADVLRAFSTLVKVNIYMKFRGFYSTIQMIKQAKYKSSNFRIPRDDELQHLANIINKACLLYPSRTKCLEWAITYVLLALKRGWKCNLEVGVQNYPFFAHAWVECNNKVIMDSQDLRDGMAIIINEPFRRLQSCSI